MRLVAHLSQNRYVAGTITVLAEQEEQIIYGPVRARGEADNTMAARHGNPEEDPTKSHGDHPAGLYQVVSAEWARKGYGAIFIRLLPVAGEAPGRRFGIGIHSGRLHDDGRLRETYGCLRVDDAQGIGARGWAGPVAETLGGLVQSELSAGRVVMYECIVE